MKRFMPHSLMGQLAALVLAAFVAAQAVSAWLLTDERSTALRTAQEQETIARSAAVVQALEAAPPETRTSILAAANSRLVHFAVAPAPGIEAAAPEALDTQFADLLGGARPLRAEEFVVSPRDGQRADPPGFLAWLPERMKAAGMAPVELRLAVPLSDGQWLNVSSSFERPGFRLPPAILGPSLLSLALVLGALWFGLRRITDPLRRLARAADSFGLEAPPPAMPGTGPREVQALAEALVRMQARLSGMIAERTQMLAALGHDLRSPITALRLRAEMVDDDETRERMVASLDEMQEMVETTLAFARGVSPDQPLEPVDLGAMLSDLAAELSRSGAPVGVVDAEPAVLALKRVPIRRALRNLLENAQRYGGGARVSLRRGPEAVEPEAVEIAIDDDGPGIPEPDLERVFAPFTRLETSRSRETGGTGLGLSIARAILRAHGGEVRLSNRPGGGLRATVRLPAA